jgi:hypothetical protein
MEMKKRVAFIWYCLPQEFAENLVKSMQQRVQAVIESQGDYTVY